MQKSRHPGNTQPWAVRFVLGIILAPIGGIIAASSLEMWLDAKELSREPARLRLRDFVENGCAENRNVEITHFAFGEKYVLTSEKNQWKTVYLPLIPSNDGETPDEGSAVTVVLITEERHNPEDMIRLFESPTVHALIPWSHRGLPRETEAKLRKANPRLDFANCLFLEEKRPPWMLKVYGFAACGIVLGSTGGALLCTGISGWIVWRRRNALRKSTDPLMEPDVKYDDRGLM